MNKIILTFLGNLIFSGPVFANSVFNPKTGMFELTHPQDKTKFLTAKEAIDYFQQKKENEVEAAKVKIEEQNLQRISEAIDDANERGEVKQVYRLQLQRHEIIRQRNLRGSSSESEKKVALEKYWSQFIPSVSTLNVGGSVNIHLDRPTINPHTGRFEEQDFDSLPASAKFQLTMAQFGGVKSKRQQGQSCALLASGAPGIDELVVRDKKLPNLFLGSEKHVYLICDTDHSQNRHLYDNPDAINPLPAPKLVQKLIADKINVVLLEGHTTEKSPQRQELSILGLENNLTKMAFAIAIIRGHQWDHSDVSLVHKSFLPNFLDVLVATYPEQFPQSERERLLQTMVQSNGQEIYNRPELEKMAEFLLKQMDSNDIRSQLLAKNDWQNLNSLREQGMLQNIFTALSVHDKAAVVVGSLHCNKLMQEMGAHFSGTGSSVVIHKGELSPNGDLKELPAFFIPTQKLDPMHPELWQWKPWNKD